MEPLTSEEYSLKAQDGAKTKRKIFHFNPFSIDDERPMQLYDKLPTFMMKPVEKLSRAVKNVSFYICPVYVYPVRTGTRENPSFLFDIRIPMAKERTEGFFIKRGTACLLSLGD